MSDSFVVSILPTGELLSIHKDDLGLAQKLRGKASIRRATHILWNEQEQAWYIEWEEENVPSWRLTWKIEDWPFLENPIGCRIGLRGGLLLFDKYQDAVDAEVKLLQHLQKSGQY